MLLEHQLRLWSKYFGGEKNLIGRYTLSEMATIWNRENRFAIWLEIEIYACEAFAKQGKIPKAAVAEIKKKAKFDIARIDEIEEEIRHDVVAFTTCLAEYVGEASRYIHMGLTSSDVVDTAFAVQLRKASDLILRQLKKFRKVLKEQALRHKNTVMIGRSHGVHAEPVTFGLKLTNWYAEFGRNIERMNRARERISVGQISGAVGTFANIDPEVEVHVCKKLGLKPAPISNQVIQRDRHAEYFTTLAVIAGSIEKVAMEIRHLQRTEVLEAEELFSDGQKGSSAMPHKRNPVVSEQMCGLARVVRANAGAALENMALWHERDISHSSVERVIGPDSTILIHYMLKKMIGLIETLIVYPKNMRKNMEGTGGLIFSQNVLLALTRKGVSREDAYRIVQKHAMQTWENGGDFLSRLKKDSQIQRHLSLRELNKAFDLKHHLKNVDYIFKRVFG